MSLARSVSLVAERVCVTGGAGFLGKRVTERLRQAGVGTVLVPTHAEYDLTDLASVRQMYDDLRPTVVIHLAAVVGGIGANRREPARFFYENLMMGANLMHEGWLRAISKFVAIGTVCAYPKHTPVPFREECLWDGYPEETNAPYGMAKKMLLVQAQAYRHQYGFNAIYLIPVNLYGPGDNFDLESSHVIPAIIRKVAEAKAREEREVVLWGDGSPTREFLYVDDAAEGIVLATEQYDGEDPINLGSGVEIPIRDLATEIARELEYDGAIIWDSTKPNGQPRRLLDVSRAERLLGFRARTAFRDGLRRTIDWYRDQS